MKIISSLFGISPLRKLELQMQQVALCIYTLQKMIPMLMEREYEELNKILVQISQLKQLGDLSKNRIESSISSRIILPVKKRAIIRCLRTQNKISHHVYRVARLFSCVPEIKNNCIESCLEDFFIKTIIPFQRALEVVFEFKELQVSSFGGSEAAKVSLMVETVIIMVKEFELELNRMLTKVYYGKNHNTASYWSNVLNEIEPIALLSGKMAHLIKTMIEK